MASLCLGSKGETSLEIVKYKRRKELIKLALQAEKHLRELEEAYNNLKTVMESLEAPLGSNI